MRWILFKLGAGCVLVKRTTYYRRVEDVYVDDKQFDTSAHVELLILASFSADKVDVK